MRMNARLMAAGVCGAALLSGCAGTSYRSATSAPEPIVAAAPANEGEAQIADLLSRMTLERKVAQLIQPDISAITPADVEKYRFGSVLNGGNSGPYNNDMAPAEDWLKLADEFWVASTKPLPNGEPAIPTIWTQG